MTTRAETLDVFAAKKIQEDDAWDAAIATEVATGRLSILNKDLERSNKGYDIAAEQLNKNPPDFVATRIVLEALEALEIKRGAGAHAAEALASLAAFEATEPDLAGEITEAPDTAAGTGTVV